MPKISPWERADEALYPRQPTPEDKKTAPESDIERGWVDALEPDDRPVMRENWSNNEPVH